MTNNSRRPAPSGIQHQGNSWKGTSGIWGKIEVSGIMVSAKNNFLLDKTLEPGSGIVPFLIPSPHRATEW